MYRFMLLLATVALLAMHSPAAMAKDFGSAQDLKQVRAAVHAQFGTPLHASVSHDWALCTSYQDESDLSIVLHRVGAHWKVVAHDGGAFGKDDLKAKGVPPADASQLLRAYQ